MVSPPPLQGQHQKLEIEFLREPKGEKLGTQKMAPLNEGQDQRNKYKLRPLIQEEIVAKSTSTKKQYSDSDTVKY